jgi:hypothetical protein
VSDHNNTLTLAQTLLNHHLLGIPKQALIWAAWVADLAMLVEETWEGAAA